MSSETWKAVPGYDGMYEVSTHGQVRSWNNNRWGRRKESQMLKPKFHAAGYPQVTLCKNGWCKSVTIHTLVLIAFVGPCPPGLECCHGDGSRTNNHLSNLRWDTRSANHWDAVEHGVWVPFRGEANGQSKLTEADVIEIRRLYARGGVLQRELGKQFGVARRTISDVVRRKLWAHVSAPEGG